MIYNVELIGSISGLDKPKGSNLVHINLCGDVYNMLNFKTII